LTNSELIFTSSANGSPSPTWKAFLDTHLKELVSVDFFVVPTVRSQILYGLIVLARGRRRIVHFNVTAHPTAQQMVEAFPFDTAPHPPGLPYGGTSFDRPSI